MERRVTVFPGNAQSFQMRRTQTSSEESTVKPTVSPTAAPVTLPPVTSSHCSDLPPRLPLKAHLSPAAGSTKNNIRDFWHRRDPREAYQSILTEDQAGLVTVAHRLQATLPIVVIKTFSNANFEHAKKLKRVLHPNIMSLVEVLSSPPTLHIVYEHMSLSLAAVQASPCRPFANYEIAAIVKEV